MKRIKKVNIERRVGIHPNFLWMWEILFINNKKKLKEQITNMDHKTCFANKCEGTTFLNSLLF